MHIWETGKEIIWGSEKGREENSTESLKLNMEKARRRSIEELWESSPQPTIFFWGCFTAFGHFQTLPFLPLRLVYQLPFPVYTCLCPLLMQFSASLLLPKQFKRVFVVPVVFHTAVLRVSVKTTENQRGNKYFPKGLDLIECLKNYGWRFITLYTRQGSKPSPRRRNAKRQNGCLRRLR